MNKLLLRPRLLIYIQLVVLLAACKSPDVSSEASVATAYKLEIADSVQVDILAAYPKILDVHKTTGEILLAQSSPPHVWILSTEGKVLKEWSKSGDGPDEIGANLLSAEFFEDKIALMGYMTVKLFDRDFNLIDIYKAGYPSSGMIYVGYNHLFEFESNGESQLVSYMGGPQTEIPSIQKEYYKAFNIVDVLSPNRHTTNVRQPAARLESEGSKTKDNTSTDFYEPVGELQPHSRYLNDRAYYLMKPEFDVRDNQLFYALTDDTTLNVLELPSGNPLRHYSIPFDEFILFEGYSLGKEGYAEQDIPRDWEGKITKLLHVDDKEVIFYTSGIKLTTLEQFRDDPDFRAQTRRINHTKYLIVKDGKRLNTELKLDKKYETPFMADDQGYIWTAQNINELEEEPDLLTFYKLRIVPGEE